MIYRKHEITDSPTIETRQPYNFDGWRILVRFKCNRCYSSWQLHYDIPRQAIHVLKPTCPPMLRDAFLNVFEKLLLDKANTDKAMYNEGKYNLFGDEDESVSPDCGGLEVEG